MIKKLFITVLLASLSLVLSGCEMADGEGMYQVSLIGYGGTFSGRYLLDPEDDKSEWVSFVSTPVEGTTYHEVNLDLSFITSLSLFADGSEDCSSLKLYFYVNGKQKEYISDSATYEGGAISSYAKVELYYEASSSDSSESSS